MLQVAKRTAVSYSQNRLVLCCTTEAFQKCWYVWTPNAICSPVWRNVISFQ